MLQGKWTISESRMFGKAESKTRPFGKELNTAMPRRHRTGIGPLGEGPPGRILSQRGPIKPSGGAQPLETVKGKGLSKRAVQVEWPVSVEGDHLSQTDHLCDVIMTS